MKLFKDEFEENCYFSGTEISNYLGLKLPTIQTLIKKGTLKGILNNNAHFTLALVQRDSGIKLKEKMKKWYSAKETQEYLDISEHAFPEFIKMLEHIEIPCKTKI